MMGEKQIEYSHPSSLKVETQGLKKRPWLFLKRILKIYAGEAEGCWKKPYFFSGLEPSPVT